MKRFLVFTGFLFTLALLAGFSLTAQAAGDSQLPQYATPTPGADGRIIYIVQPGDNCLRIQLLTGVPIDQLRTLNRLDEACSITEGQQLVIGFVELANTTPTAGPAPTATPALPTPTPFAGTANLCIRLFDDVNGDALRQDTEVMIGGGAISVLSASGQFSQTATTVAGTDPVCFSEVPEGKYNISVAAPSEYYPTTQLSTEIEIKAGTQVEIPFGAQKSEVVIEEPGEEGGSGRSMLVGILGGVMLLLGIGLAIYSWLTYGRKPSFRQPPNPPTLAR
jgi:hypothetical protein